MSREDFNRQQGFVDGKAVLTPYPWRLVTGLDFGRSIRWARRQPRLAEVLKVGKSESRKLIEQADSGRVQKSADNFGPGDGLTGGRS